MQIGDVLTLRPRGGAESLSAASVQWTRVIAQSQSLCEMSAHRTATDLAAALSESGLSVSAAVSMPIASLMDTLRGRVGVGDAGVVFAALRQYQRGGAVGMALTDPPPPQTWATAPLPDARARGWGASENIVACAGAHAAATSERNAHAALGVAGGATLALLWKSLQDETAAAKAAGVSQGVGQDVYFGVLAAAVPCVAVAVGLSMVLAATAQISAASDVSAARFLSVPVPARYADAATFATAAIAAAVAHAFLLHDTPQGQWVTWVFAGCAGAALVVAVPIAVVVAIGARQPFGSPDPAASLPFLRERFQRLLDAAGEWRRQEERRAFARNVLVAAASLDRPPAARASGLTTTPRTTARPFAPEPV